MGGDAHRLEARVQISHPPGKQRRFPERMLKLRFDRFITLDRILKNLHPILLEAIQLSGFKMEYLLFVGLLFIVHSYA